MTMPLCGETDSQAGKNLLTLNRFQEFLDRFENHEHEILNFSKSFPAKYAKIPGNQDWG